MKYVYIAEDLVIENADQGNPNAGAQMFDDLLMEAVDIISDAAWRLSGNINLPKNGLRLGPAKITIELLEEQIEDQVAKEEFFGVPDLGKWGLPLPVGVGEDMD